MAWHAATPGGGFCGHTNDVVGVEVDGSGGRVAVGSAAKATADVMVNAATTVAPAKAIRFVLYISHLLWTGCPDLCHTMTGLIG